MELRLEIKLASVEELAQIASSLRGLTVESTERKVTPQQVPTPVAAPVSQTVVSQPVAKPEAKPEVKGNSAKDKKLTAAEKKAAKKAQEEAEKAERIARLKANMEKEASTLAANAPVNNTPAQEAPQAQVAPAQQTEQEDPNAIVNEIKTLGDTLMAFQGMPIEDKQALTVKLMQQVGAPQGVRPTQLQQPALGQFRDAYRAQINSIVNPVMGGLV